MLSVVNEPVIVWNLIWQFDLSLQSNVWKQLGYLLETGEGNCQKRLVVNWIWTIGIHWSIHSHSEIRIVLGITN